MALGLGVGIVAAAAMSLPNAPLDAARLDVMPARLRGRSESLRALLRAAAFASAPLLFGWVADRFRTDHTTGTRNAFLLMLIPLFISGVVLLWARRSYLRDIATAGAIDERRDDR